MTLESKSVKNRENSLEKRADEKEAKISPRTKLTLQLAGAAIFGALSAVAYPALKPLIDLTRVPEGLALFDPISIIWMTCFMLFGPIAGLLCCTVGFITLIPFDTSIPVIAPAMKFAATLPLMIVPILVLRLYKKENGSQKLKKPKNFIISGVLGIVVRDIVMIIFNIVVYITFFGRAGLEAWLVLIIWINIITSIWDLSIPYAIVFGALDYGLKLNDKFEIW